MDQRLTPANAPKYNNAPAIAASLTQLKENRRTGHSKFCDVFFLQRSPVNEQVVHVAVQLLIACPFGVLAREEVAAECDRLAARDPLPANRLAVEIERDETIIVNDCHMMILSVGK